jgi:uncharacterized protein YegP (UPF0339 family)
MPQFEVFRDAGENWRWRLVAGNGRNVATSGEAFASRSNAVRAARDVARVAPDARLPLLRAAKKSRFSFATIQGRPPGR